jgi:hypothetical protein
MKAWTVVGYTYEADLHCVGCARARFADPDHAIDSEGNPAHPIFASDWTPSDRCGDCGDDLG